MFYSINQLTKLSGVSSRTLRYYDQIGLLKPAFCGKNNCRFYEQKDLISLQQILFFRELDYPLKDIQSIIKNDDFDQIESLKSHHILLTEKTEKINSMLKTINKTISHIQDKIKMAPEEFFNEIKLQNPQVQKEYDKYLIENGVLNQEEIDKGWNKIRSWSEDDWKNFKGRGDTFYQQMSQMLNQKFSVNSEPVQELVHQQYMLIKPLWMFNKNSYRKLAESYLENTPFRKFCALYHPKLLEFIVESMEVYADHQLS